MRIALTYDLRDDYLRDGFSLEETAEFDQVGTVEAIEAALRDLGHETVRVGRLAALIEELRAEDTRVPSRRWDLVFNICEGMRGIGREAQVPAVLDAYGIPYTASDPLVCSLTLHKAMCKRVVRDLGVRTPRFFVFDGPSDLGRADGFAYPLFAKPVAEGTSKGITARSMCTTPEQLSERCGALQAEYRQPVLVEEYLPGREVTVAVLGTGDAASVLGVLEVSLLSTAEADIYTYLNKEECESRVKYTLATGSLAEEAAEMALAVHRGLGCRDISRVDLRQDPQGRLSFMEVNPLPGMHPEHSDLPIMCTAAGIPYRELISRIVESAALRISARAIVSGALA